MADIVIYEFKGAHQDHRGVPSLLTTEPALRRSTITLGGTTQYFAPGSECDYMVVMPSSGGASFWYNSFTTVATATNVVSAGFPERKCFLPQEGDWEVIAGHPPMQFGFRGS